MSKLDVDPRGFAQFDNDTGMWVEEARAIETSEQGTRNQRFPVPKDMVAVQLLPVVPSVAPRAPAMTVEDFERFCFWR